MLIPAGESVSLRSSPDSTFCDMKLSPNGKVIAAVTTRNIQLWSAGPQPILLAQNYIERSSSMTEDLLKRMFIVWNQDGTKFAIVSGEGMIVIISVEYLEIRYGDDIEGNQIVFIPSCKIKSSLIVDHSENGCPLSVCSMDTSLLYGTDLGYLVNVDWDGKAQGYPINCPINIHLHEIHSELPEKLQICSLDYNPYIQSLAVVLNNGMCFLFGLEQQKRIYFTSAHVLLHEGVSIVRFGSECNILAIGHVDGSISIYRLKWANESLIPNCCYKFDVHRFNDLYPPPYSMVSSSPSASVPTVITSLTWNRQNDHLAVCYAGRSLCVWNFQEIPIWWNSVKEACCVWSVGGDMLFYGGRSLFYQSFFITDNIILSTSVISPPYSPVPVSLSSAGSKEMMANKGYYHEQHEYASQSNINSINTNDNNVNNNNNVNSDMNDMNDTKDDEEQKHTFPEIGNSSSYTTLSFCAYNSHSLLLSYSPPHGHLFSLIPIPQSFLDSCDWPFMGKSVYPGSSHVALWTASDVCVYVGECDLWKIANNIVHVGNYEIFHH